MTSTSGSGATISSLVQPAQKGKNVRDVERCGDNIECARCRHNKQLPKGFIWQLGRDHLDEGDAVPQKE